MGPALAVPFMIGAAATTEVAADAAVGVAAAEAVGAGVAAAESATVATIEGVTAVTEAAEVTVAEVETAMEVTTVAEAAEVTEGAEIAEVANATAPQRTLASLVQGPVRQLVTIGVGSLDAEIVGEMYTDITQCKEFFTDAYGMGRLMDLNDKCQTLAPPEQPQPNQPKLHQPAPVGGPLDRSDVQRVENAPALQPPPASTTSLSAPLKGIFLMKPASQPAGQPASQPANQLATQSACPSSKEFTPYERVP